MKQFLVALAALLLASSVEAVTIKSKAGVQDECDQYRPDNCDSWKCPALLESCVNPDTGFDFEK